LYGRYPGGDRDRVAVPAGVHGILGKRYLCRVISDKVCGRIQIEKGVRLVRFGDGYLYGASRNDVCRVTRKGSYGRSFTNCNYGWTVAFAAARDIAAARV